MTEWIVVDSTQMHQVQYIYYVGRWYITLSNIMHTILQLLRLLLQQLSFTVYTKHK